MANNISMSEAVSVFQSKMQEYDDKFDSIVNRILDETDILLKSTDEGKYESVVSVEYLLVKLRLDTEFEHVKIKSLLNNADTPPAVRSILLKRDQLLAQRVLKLNSIRDDISVLQKTVYTQSTRTIK